MGSSFIHLIRTDSNEFFLMARDMCTPMFIAALFIIVRTWKQPRCPSADEWIRKLWYIYTMEYYSAIKKKPWSFKVAADKLFKLWPRGKVYLYYSSPKVNLSSAHMSSNLDQCGLVIKDYPFRSSTIMVYRSDSPAGLIIFKIIIQIKYFNIWSMCIYLSTINSNDINPERMNLVSFIL